MLIRKRRKIASLFSLIFSICPGVSTRQLTFHTLLFITLLVLLSGAEILAEAKKKKLKEQDIIQRVLKDYDWRVRPRGNNDTWPGNFNVRKKK